MPLIASALDFTLNEASAHAKPISDALSAFEIAVFWGLLGVLCLVAISAALIAYVGERRVWILNIRMVAATAILWAIQWALAFNRIIPDVNDLSFFFARLICIAAGFGAGILLAARHAWRKPEPNRYFLFIASVAAVLIVLSFALFDSPEERRKATVTLMGLFSRTQ